MLYSVGTVKPSSHVVHYTLYMWPGIWVWSVDVPIMPLKTQDSKKKHTLGSFLTFHTVIEWPGSGELALFVQIDNNDDRRTQPITLPLALVHRVTKCC